MQESLQTGFHARPGFQHWPPPHQLHGEMPIGLADMMSSNSASPLIVSMAFDNLMAKSSLMLSARFATGSPSSAIAAAAAAALAFAIFFGAMIQARGDLRLES